MRCDQKFFRLRLRHLHLLELCDAMPGCSTCLLVNQRARWCRGKLKLRVETFCCLTLCACCLVIFKMDVKERNSEFASNLMQISSTETLVKIQRHNSSCPSGKVQAHQDLERPTIEKKFYEQGDRFLWHQGNRVPRICSCWPDSEF